MSDQPHEQQVDQNREQAPDSTPPMVWIGSLADYNNGILQGDWMDAAVEASELYEKIQQMLAQSREPAPEEWMVFDYEGFGGYRVGEYADIDALTAVARGIAEHGEAFGAYAQLHDGDPEQLDRFEEAFLGAYESRQDWAQTIVDDFGIEEAISKDLPDWLAAHVTIDLAGIAHDMEIGGDVSVEDNPAGGIWVFDGRV